MVAIGQNEPCPCGSGKMYKHCCLGKEPPPRMSSVMDELRAAIAGKTFNSIDDANALPRTSWKARTGFRNWISWGFPRNRCTCS